MAACRRLRVQWRRLRSDGMRGVADVDRLLAEEVELEQARELDRREEEFRRKQPHRLRRAAEMAGVAVVTGVAFVGVSIWFNAAIQGALDTAPNLRHYELFAGFVFLRCCKVSATLRRSLRRLARVEWKRSSP